MSAATRIPPELFEEILWYVCRRDLPPGWIVYDDDRRNVSSCGRVCQHWAVPCRLKLFDDIILRSAEDVQELKAMLDSPPPCFTMPALSNIIQHFRLDVCDDVPPWIHLVRLMIIPRMRVSSPDIRLHFSGSQPGESRVIRTNRTDFYGLVPHSLPSMAPILTTLLLVHVHFNNGAELCRLLASYPMLKRIRLFELTWITPPVCDDFLFLQLGPSAVFIETKCGKGQELPATWFFPALTARTEKPLRSPSLQDLQNTPRLHPEDYKLLAGLFGALHGQEEPATADDQLQHWAIRRRSDVTSEICSTC